MKSPGLTPHLLSATLFLVTACGAGLEAQEVMANPPAARAAKRAEELLQRFDKNSDGKLDDEERADAKEAMMKEQMGLQMARAESIPGGPEAYRARLLELFDTNKDGRLDDEERTAAQKFAAERGFNANGELRDELIKRFDKNANGRIDEDERGPLQEFVKERMMSGPGLPNREAQEKVELEKVLRSAIQDHPAQLKLYDQDNDGRLSDQEWVVARARIGRALAPSPVEEQRQLQAVAEEVTRRRKLREEATPVPLPRK